MKRVVKFRGKRCDNGAWVYGSYHLHQDTMLCIASKEQVEKNLKSLIIYDGMSDWNMSVPLQYVEVVPESVGELTDLKDKNGKEIYEGDILARTTIPDRIVYWDVCGFYTRKINGHGITPLRIDDFDVIVGNIYENPELIQ